MIANEAKIPGNGSGRLKGRIALPIVEIIFHTEMMGLSTRSQQKKVTRATITNELITTTNDGKLKFSILRKHAQKIHALPPNVFLVWWNLKKVSLLNKL